MNVQVDEKGVNIVTVFMYYIFNKWNYDEAVIIFGENLGKHIYKKWVQCRNINYDQLGWYADLDTTCRNKLVQRAIDTYEWQPAN